MSRGADNVAVGREKHQIAANAELRNRGVDGADLQPGATGITTSAPDRQTRGGAFNTFPARSRHPTRGDERGHRDVLAPTM